MFEDILLQPTFLRWINGYPSFKESIRNVQVLERKPTECQMIPNPNHRHCLSFCLFGRKEEVWKFTHLKRVTTWSQIFAAFCSDSVSNWKEQFRKYIFFYYKLQCNTCPGSPERRRPKCDQITPPHLLSWPCVSDLLYWSKRPRAATRHNPRWLDSTMKN